MLAALENINETDTAVLNGTAGKVKPNPGIRFKDIPLKFDIEIIDLLLSYAYDDTSAHITRAALINLKSLIEMVNMKVYKHNHHMRIRMEFLKLLLEARLERGLDNRRLMLTFAMDNIEQKDFIRNEVLPELAKFKLNPRAIQHLNAFVVDNLIHGFMYAYKEQFFKIYEDMEAGNYKNLRELTQGFKSFLTDLIFDIRTSESYRDENMSVDLSSGTFENVVLQLATKLLSPNNKLLVGSQAINMLLNGGFEAGRSYIFFGLPGIGKSGVLLNICEWLRMHNKVTTKDPTKRAAILYITQENSLAETIERLFNMNVTGDDIRDYTPEEIVHLLRTKGRLELKTKDDIDFIMRYYDDKEISTTDLYSIVDDIEDTGREVIALVHDYIERINSSLKLVDLRLELAAVANDYSVLAKRLNIPVISAGQINRKGSDTIDSGSDANRKDVIRMLGKGAVSESWAMLKNIDVAFFIHREIDEDGNEYICFLKIKFRGNPGKKKNRKKNVFESYLAHPIDPDNGIKLLDDIHLAEPLSKISLDDSAGDTNVLKKSKSLREKKEFKPRAESFEEFEEEPMNFRVLEDAIKMRKKVEERTDKVTESKAEKQFEKSFEAYVDPYVRNDAGYIIIKPKKVG